MCALNLNKIGKPIAVINGGKYNGQIVSLSDKSNDKDNDNLIREFKMLKIPTR
jgi:uncharacterized protein YhbP (UPF0306 family)